MYYLRPELGSSTFSPKLNFLLLNKSLSFASYLKPPMSIQLLICSLWAITWYYFISMLRNVPKIWIIFFKNFQIYQKKIFHKDACAAVSNLRHVFRKFFIAVSAWLLKIYAINLLKCMMAEAYLVWKELKHTRVKNKLSILFCLPVPSTDIPSYLLHILYKDSSHIIKTELAAKTMYNIRIKLNVCFRGCSRASLYVALRDVQTRKKVFNIRVYNCCSTITNSETLLATKVFRFVQI